MTTVKIPPFDATCQYQAIAADIEKNLRAVIRVSARKKCPKYDI